MSSTTHRFKPGESGNPSGRPKGKSVSRLRSTLTLLKEMESDALENIKKAVTNEAVSKTALDTSKWIISTISSMSRTAVVEETAREERWERERAIAERPVETNATETDVKRPAARYVARRIVDTDENEDEDDE